MKPDESLEMVIERLVAEFPEHEACRDRIGIGKTASFSFSEIFDKSRRISRYITPLIREGDIEADSKRPVAVCMTRGSLWYSSFLALIYLGIPVAPMTQDIADESAQASRNKMILSSLKPLLVLIDHTTPESIKEQYRIASVSMVAIESCLTAQAPCTSAISRLRDISQVPMAYLYTGGTTSGCKCVQVSHAMAMHEMRSYPPLFSSNRTSGQIVLQNSSTYWGATFLGQINIALSLGACIVFSDNPTDLTSIINEEKVTIIGVVPSQLRALSGPCPSLVTVFTWGEKLSMNVAKKWCSAQTRVIELLVSTEYWLSLYSVKNDCIDENFSVIDSPNVDVKIHNGELIIGGDCVTSFGYTDEGINESVLITIDNKRYFRTRDLARITENGKIQFMGRADSLIKIGGEWKDLFSIESALRQVPNIEDVCIVPQTRFGKPAVFIVVTRGQMRNFPEIRKIVNESYLQLFFVHRLPRNMVTGKVDRSRLLLHIDSDHDCQESIVRRRRIVTCVGWLIFQLIFLIYVVFISSFLGMVLLPYLHMFVIQLSSRRCMRFMGGINQLVVSLAILSFSPLYISTCISLFSFFVRKRDYKWLILFWLGVPRQIEKWYRSFTTSHTTGRRDRVEQNERSKTVHVDHQFLVEDDGDKKNLFSKIEILNFELEEIFNELRNDVMIDCPGITFPITPSSPSPLAQSVMEIVEKTCDMLPLPISPSTSLSGLSSLVAVMLSNQIRESLNYLVAVSDILKCLHVHDLVSLIETSPKISILDKKSSESVVVEDTSYRCQLWGWGLPCTWLFEASSDNGYIHFKSLRQALSIISERHSAFRAVPSDHSSLYYWINDVLVTFGLIKWMAPRWLSGFLGWIGSWVFNGAPKICAQKNKKFYLSWNDTVFKSRSELLAHVSKGFRPPVTAEILTLEEQPGGSKRQFLRLSLSHAFSDGSCIVPILNELNILYEKIINGELEEGNMETFKPVDGLRIQESRLHSALASSHPSDNDLYLCYNIDFSSKPNDGFGETVLMKPSFIAICHATCFRINCSIDVLFLSALVCALARLQGPLTRMIPLSLIVPLRDSPGRASEAVGFLADLRNIDVFIGSPDLVSLLSIVQSVIEIRRDRKWIIPDPFSSCERILVNIIPGAGQEEGKRFRQELNVLQSPGRSFVRNMTRPAEIYIEQISRIEWTFRSRYRYQEWDEEKSCLFIDMFKKVVMDILINPNQPLFSHRYNGS